MEQSGLLDRRVLSLINDYELVAKVKEAADSTESGEFGDILDSVYSVACAP